MSKESINKQIESKVGTWDERILAADNGVYLDQTSPLSLLLSNNRI